MVSSKINKRSRQATFDDEYAQAHKKIKQPMAFIEELLSRNMSVDIIEAEPRPHLFMEDIVYERLPQAAGQSSMSTNTYLDYYFSDEHEDEEYDISSECSEDEESLEYGNDSLLVCEGQQLFIDNDELYFSEESSDDFDDEEEGSDEEELTLNRRVYNFEPLTISGYNRTWRRISNYL